MRIQEPYEMFCSHCGGYQYCAKFDELVGSKRRFPDANLSAVVDEKDSKRNDHLISTSNTASITSTNVC